MAYRNHSVYCGQCVCGTHFESAVERFTCQGCGREQLMVWQGAAPVPASLPPTPPTNVEESTSVKPKP